MVKDCEVCYNQGFYVIDIPDYEKEGTPLFCVEIVTCHCRSGKTANADVAATLAELQLCSGLLFSRDHGSNKSNYASKDC